MTTTEFLDLLVDLLIAELDRLLADNRRLNLELAAAISRHDGRSNVSPLQGFTGGPVLW